MIGSQPDLPNLPWTISLLPEKVIKMIISYYMVSDLFSGLKWASLPIIFDSMKDCSWQFIECIFSNISNHFLNIQQSSVKQNFSENYVMHQILFLEIEEKASQTLQKYY